MVVNMASLPSTDTFVTGLGRNGAPEGGALCCGRACAFAPTEQRATPQHRMNNLFKTDFVMWPVAILTLCDSPPQREVFGLFFDEAHHPATIQGVAVKSQEIRLYISLLAANDCAPRRISK